VPVAAFFVGSICSPTSSSEFPIARPTPIAGCSGWFRDVSMVYLPLHSVTPAKDIDRHSTRPASCTLLHSHLHTSELRSQYENMTVVAFYGSPPHCWSRQRQILLPHRALSRHCHSFDLRERFVGRTRVPSVPSFCYSSIHEYLWRR
jgi:hypothetical protein